MQADRQIEFPSCRYTGSLLGGDTGDRRIDTEVLFVPPSHLSSCICHPPFPAPPPQALATPAGPKPISAAGPSAASWGSVPGRAGTPGRVVRGPAQHHRVCRRGSGDPFRPVVNRGQRLEVKRLTTTQTFDQTGGDRVHCIPWVRV